MINQQSSFLPEDYVEQRAERRMVVIGVTLFVIIMGAVVAAFFVTNRQWSTLRTKQTKINTAYSAVAERIDELTALEHQMQLIDQKAAITAALIEPVPRSILLAELINYMPDEVSLDSFELKSTRIKNRHSKSPGGKSKVRSLSSAKAGAAQKTTKAEDAQKRPVQAPKFIVSLVLIGLAPSDIQVSEYIRNLNQTKMLTEVELKFTREVKLNNRTLRQFRIEAKLAPNADVKSFEPLRESRIKRNPMDTTIRIDRATGDFSNILIEKE